MTKNEQYIFLLLSVFFNLESSCMMQTPDLHSMDSVLLNYENTKSDK